MLCRWIKWREEPKTGSIQSLLLMQFNSKPFIVSIQFKTFYCFNSIQNLLLFQFNSEPLIVSIQCKQTLLLIQFKTFYCFNSIKTLYWFNLEHIFNSKCNYIAQATCYTQISRNRNYGNKEQYSFTGRKTSFKVSIINTWRGAITRAWVSQLAENGSWLTNYKSGLEGSLCKSLRKT